MSETKIFTLQEVKEQATSSKPLLIIDNAVYDVTTFLNEHPGGEEVLLEQSGRDATEQFEDVGHSSDAREMMTKYKIGDIAESDRTETVRKEEPIWEAETDTSSSWTSWIIPAALAIAATVIYRFFFTK